MQNWLKIISISLLFWSCESTVNSSKKFTIQGETQGTTYQIIIANQDVDISKKDIDSILHDFDMILSTYIETSLISKLNNSTESIELEDSFSYFKQVYELSQSIYKISNGAFDPSVYPLISGWGFLKNLETPLSQREVDSILQFVSFEPKKLHEIQFESSKIKLNKKDFRFKLDFNAIAQGLSVDIIARYLDSQHIENYYIEIGGEIYVKGKNPDGAEWKIGIDSPEETNDNTGTRKIQKIISASNVGIATSGNYRKFYEVDGVKYAHTLNPKTGFPVQHSLLSATVIAPSCAEADAFATVFMVLGLEESKKLLKQHKNLKLQVHFIYSDEKGTIQNYVWK
jgi:thiamine biosynthesis lipoprotein